MMKSVPSVSCQKPKTMLLPNVISSVHPGQTRAKQQKDGQGKWHFRERSKRDSLFLRKESIYVLMEATVQNCSMSGWLSEQKHRKSVPAVVPWNKHDWFIGIFRGEITGEVKLIRPAGKCMHYPAPLYTSRFRDHALEGTGPPLFYDAYHRAFSEGLSSVVMSVLNETQLNEMPGNGMLFLFVFTHQ